MPELTVEDLKTKEAGTIIGTGTLTEPILHKNEVRWVAVIGGGHDWAIYYHFSSHPVEYVRRSGDKVMTKSLIKRLVPCTDEALDRYRF
jgi:hypothetical protein